MKIQKLIDRFSGAGVRTVAVVDLQWGDTGKGKLVDAFGEWAHVIARGTGGANAGHTIYNGDQKLVFHLIPSGILYDKEGKTNVIGRGVAVDPHIIAEELGSLAQAGLTYQGLRISHRAPLVLPLDIVLDRLKEGAMDNGHIGTTGRGIGPTYESQVGRIGLTVNDLLNKDVFAQKLKRNFEARRALFDHFDPQQVERVIESKGVGNRYWGGVAKLFDLDAIVETYLEYAKNFSEFVVDTDELMQQAMRRLKRVLLEGAQGTLLSIRHGTYPFVTSSDCSLGGLCEGVGLRSSDVGYCLGVAKAPYMTRVGDGPFPTELTGEEGDLIRAEGNEFGATTGRARRVGWLDLPLLRYALPYVRVGRSDVPATIALTKVDVLNDWETIRLCTSYRYTGNKYRVGKTTIGTDDIVTKAVPDPEVLAHCEPEYLSLPGWKCSLKEAKTREGLPRPLQNIITTIENQTFARVEVLSTGPGRDDLLAF